METIRMDQRDRSPQKLYSGKKMNTNYSELEDFKDMANNQDFKKILVVGEVGRGKSALCSKLVGVHLVRWNPKEPASKYGVLKRFPKKGCPFIKPPFRSKRSADSVTKKTSYVLAYYLGDPRNQKVMIIDTPGYSDATPLTDKYVGRGQKWERKSNFSKDMMDKLQALKEIHAIVIMMKIDDGARIGETELATIKSINSMFDNQQKSMCSNYIFAYSKCDGNKLNDIQQLVNEREISYNKILQTMINDGISMNTMPVPQLFFLSSKNPNEEEISQIDEFKNMIKMINKCEPINTCNVLNPHDHIESNSYSIYQEYYTFLSSSFLIYHFIVELFQ